MEENKNNLENEEIKNTKKRKSDEKLEKQKEKKEHKNGNKKHKDKIQMYRTMIITAILIALILTLFFLFQTMTTKKPDDEKYNYNNLLNDLKDKKIEKVEMTKGSYQVSVVKTEKAYEEDLKKKREEAKVNEGNKELQKELEDEEDLEKLLTLFGINDTTRKRTVSVLLPSVDEFVKVVQEKIDKGSELVFEIKDQPLFGRIVSTFFSLLPTILIGILFYVMLKMQGLGDKSKIYDDQENKNTGVKFADVAGLDEEKSELIEVVDFLKNPKKFEKMGAKIPRGILLFGKPGTGKTLIAKAIAGEASVPFISMSGSEFIEMFAGLGASRVRKLFDRARKISPAIIFIDEIDAIGSSRTASSGGAETENNQTLNQLLVEMDGFDTDENVIVLAATNRPEMLDKALLRPGRFDRIIVIPTPDLVGREEILRLHGKNKKFADDVDFKELAADTSGFTGAELYNILNESAIIAARREHKLINKDDVEEAVKKVLIGLEKDKRVISKKDKNITAYHEAGHAVVSTFLPTQSIVKELSIIPRGMAGGYTSYKSEEDKSYLSKTELLEQIISLMGGRVAEELFVGDISTGASNDIERATEIAKNMIAVYGMSSSVGPISLDFDKDKEMAFFGEEITKEVGVEVKQIIEEQYKIAKNILIKNEAKMHEIVKELLKKEKLNEEEFASFFKDVKLPEKVD